MESNPTGAYRELPAQLILAGVDPLSISMVQHAVKLGGRALEWFNYTQTLPVGSRERDHAFGQYQRCRREAMAAARDAAAHMTQLYEGVYQAVVASGVRPEDMPQRMSWYV